MGNVAQFPQKRRNNTAIKQGVKAVLMEEIKKEGWQRYPLETAGMLRLATLADSGVGDAATRAIKQVMAMAAELRERDAAEKAAAASREPTKQEAFVGTLATFLPPGAAGPAG